MKKMYTAISIVLVLSAFQAAPVLGGEPKQATQTYAGSNERISADWERLTVPFSFSPAPPWRHGETEMTVTAGISSVGHAPVGRLAAGREELQAPMGFSPAPPSGHEQAAAGKNGPASPPSLSAKEPGGYAHVRAGVERRGTPLGFFPAMSRECEYGTC